MYLTNKSDDEDVEVNPRHSPRYHWSEVRDTREVTSPRPRPGDETESECESQTSLVAGRGEPALHQTGHPQTTHTSSRLVIYDIKIISIL